VKWWWTILTLALVAWWPLATSHCSWEQLGGLDFLACATEADATPHQDDTCQTDACASVESGFYKIEEARPVIPAPVLHLDALTFVVPTLEVRGFVADVPIVSAPPELPTLWRFSHRVALPPRAPALAS